MSSFPLADLGTEVRAALEVLQRVQAHPDIPPKFGPMLDSTVADTSRVLREVLVSSVPPADFCDTVAGDFDPIHDPGA